MFPNTTIFNVNIPKSAKSVKWKSKELFSIGWFLNRLSDLIGKSDLTRIDGDTRSI